MIDIRLPSMEGMSESQQLSQLKSYMYQLVEQLNWALSTVQQPSVDKADQQGSSAGGVKLSESNFNEIKSLIVKSADVAHAVYDQISTTLDGEYVSISDFGKYEEETSQSITANDKSIEQILRDIQQITSSVAEIESTIIATNAYIKSGLLYYGEDGSAVYGLEVGQTNTIDGEDVFDKFARFTSDRLSFYDRNDVEVAYISDYKLFITSAQVTGTLRLGDFAVETTNSRLVFRWVGDV